MSEFDPEQFDPEAFMQETTEEANSTAYLQLPEGEYQAVVDKVENPKSFPRKDGDGHTIIMNVVYAVSGQPVNEELGQDPIRVRQGLFLDFKGNNLDFGKGKNVGLGRLRAALNQNSGAWNPKRMEGAGPVLIKVSHRIDKNGNPQAEVKSVGSL